MSVRTEHIKHTQSSNSYASYHFAIDVQKHVGIFLFSRMYSLLHLTTSTLFSPFRLSALKSPQNKKHVLTTANVWVPRCTLCERLSCSLDIYTEY